ncbi:MAG: hypothetical protein IJ075_06470 [Lachnospiraceae bacterium]|nr:hypothetical protein [Lachnospiraceae bacterium]
MARTYKKAAKTEAAPAPAKPAISVEPVSSEKAAEPQSTVTKTQVKPSVKAPAKAADSVISSPDKSVMQKIVYQPSSQILTREVGPDETFGIGDDMPIYYL